MTYTHKEIPEPQAIFEAWRPFQELIGVTSIKTEKDYEHVIAIMDTLLDEIRDDENHPFADVLHFLGDLVEKYEDEHVVIPEAEPRETLRFFMDQSNLKQEDLADCAPQARISDILNGKRSISKGIAKNLARRFGVHADLFL